MSDRSPGSICTLSYDYEGPTPPEAGDFVLTRAGSSYRIDTVRRSPTRPGRVYLGVTRLERNAVAEGDPGVWMLYWYRRRRTAP